MTDTNQERKIFQMLETPTSLKLDNSKQNMFSKLNNFVKKIPIKTATNNSSAMKISNNSLTSKISNKSRYLDARNKSNPKPSRIRETILLSSKIIESNNNTIEVSSNLSQHNNYSSLPQQSMRLNTESVSPRIKTLSKFIVPNNINNEYAQRSDTSPDMKMARSKKRKNSILKISIKNDNNEKKQNLGMQELVSLSSTNKKLDKSGKIVFNANTSILSFMKSNSSNFNIPKAKPKIGQKDDRVNLILARTISLQDKRLYGIGTIQNFGELRIFKHWRRLSSKENFKEKRKLLNSKIITKEFLPDVLQFNNSLQEAVEHPDSLPQITNIVELAFVSAKNFKIRFKEELNYLLSKNIKQGLDKNRLNQISKFKKLYIESLTNSYSKVVNYFFLNLVSCYFSVLKGVCKNSIQDKQAINISCDLTGSSSQSYDITMTPTTAQILWTFDGNLNSKLSEFKRSGIIEKIKDLFQYHFKDSLTVKISNTEMVQTLLEYKIMQKSTFHTKVLKETLDQILKRFNKFKEKLLQNVNKLCVHLNAIPMNELESSYKSFLNINFEDTFSFKNVKFNLAPIKNNLSNLRVEIATSINNKLDQEINDKLAIFKVYEEKIVNKISELKSSLSLSIKLKKILEIKKDFYTLNMTYKEMETVINDCETFLNNRKHLLEGAKNRIKVINEMFIAEEQRINSQFSSDEIFRDLKELKQRVELYSSDIEKEYNDMLKTEKFELEARSFDEFENLKNSLVNLIEMLLILSKSKKEFKENLELTCENVIDMKESVLEALTVQKVDEIFIKELHIVMSKMDLLLAMIKSNLNKLELINNILKELDDVEKSIINSAPRTKTFDLLQQLNQTDFGNNPEELSIKRLIIRKIMVLLKEIVMDSEFYKCASQAEVKCLEYINIDEIKEILLSNMGHDEHTCLMNRKIVKRLSQIIKSGTNTNESVDSFIQAVNKAEKSLAKIRLSTNNIFVLQEQMKAQILSIENIVDNLASFGVKNFLKFRLFFLNTENIKQLFFISSNADILIPSSKKN